MLYILRTVIFSLEGAIKRSTANVRMPRWRKKECRETKTEIRIMLHFMQLAHPRHMDIYVQNSKHKSQNTEVTSFEQNTKHLYTKHNVKYRLPYIAVSVCSSFKGNFFLYTTMYRQ